MFNSKTYNTAQYFENLFLIFSSLRFLNKEGLGGTLPFFIHSFPVNKQDKVNEQVAYLKKRLLSNSIEVFEIDLYAICIDILKKENLFDQIVQQEQRMPKQRLLRVLSGPLNIDTILIPEIQRRIALKNPKIIFITGIGAAFPVIRSHTILNNLQTLVGNLPLVMFFPGTYNNLSLNLFDQLKDDNYYQAHNLNDYTI